MAPSDVFSDDDIDAMLRHLLDDAPAPRGWAEVQRARLLAHVDGGTPSTTGVGTDAAPDAVVVVPGPPAGSRPDRTRRIVVAAAAAAVVAIGAVATLRLDGDRRSDVPAATDVPVATGAPAADPVVTPPPITTVTASSPLWPALLPVITPEASETVSPTLGQIAIENPASTSAVLARVDGSSVTDIVRVAAVETEPYESVLADLYGAPTETPVDGVPVVVYEPGEGTAAFGGPVAVLELEDGLSIVVYGADPLGFLATAGTDFAHPGRAASGTAGALTLTFGDLPVGYSMIAEPQALQRGALQPGVSLDGGETGLVAEVVVTSVTPPLDIGLAAEGSITRTSDGEYWMEDEASGSPLVWEVGDGEWITIASPLGPNATPLSLEQALAVASRIELVDVETWLARYPEALQMGAEVGTEADPAASTEPAEPSVTAVASTAPAVTTATSPVDEPEQTIYHPEPLHEGDRVIAAIVPVEGVALGDSTVSLQIVDLPDGRFLELDLTDAVIPEDAAFWTTEINGRSQGRSTAHQGGTMGQRVDEDVYGTTLTVVLSAIAADGTLLATTGEVQVVDSR